jgi:hypothetical protein
MRGSKSQLVADTSALIGIRPGPLLVRALHLPYEWLIPDVVDGELKSPTSLQIKNTLRACGCQTRPLNSRQVRRGEHLITLYPRASRIDIFALVMAHSLGAILLTGDNALRAAAVQEGVVVHGLIWLLDELVDGGALPPLVAVAELRQIVATGTWLPKDEVSERLRRWSQP